MTDTTNPIATAETNLQKAAAELDHLRAERARVLNDLGAARATGALTTNHRQRLAEIDGELAELTAAQPHLQKAYNDAVAAANAERDAKKREQLVELAQVRREHAAKIDEHVQALAATLGASRKATRESMTLAKEMRLPGAEMIEAQRQEALAHNIAFQVRELLGSLPNSIQPGYQMPFAAVEDELLTYHGL
jgi:hypothetical protein